LVGVAPFNRDSGRCAVGAWSGGGRVRTDCVRVVHGALAAIRCNPVIKAFYQRLRAAGKESKLALTACMRKLLTILNAIIKSGTPWQKHQSQST